MRKLLSLITVFVISLLTVSLVAAVPSESNLGSLTGAFYPWDITVEVNGEDYRWDSQRTQWWDGFTWGTNVAVEEGEDLDIKVTLRNQGPVDAKGIEVLARISGYEYSDSEELQDTTGLFDVKAGTRKSVKLNVPVPTDLTNGENALRIFVLDRNSQPIQISFPLEVESPRHSVNIEDVTFSPGNTVKAGRSLLANVLVENFGDRTEEDVKVTVAIPELGLSASEFIDEIKADDSESVSGDFNGGLMLNIPADAAAREYDVVVTAQYKDLKETVKKAFKLTVVGNEQFANVDKLVLAVGPETQTVAVGAAASYGIALTNAGSASKAYTLKAVTGDWASASLSESLVVLEPGKNAVVYVDVKVPNDAPTGAHAASVSVMSGNEVLETVTLNANVVDAKANSAGRDSGSLRNGLEIALIVLVVLLVIIGLIVGFSRLRKDDEDDQTYY